MICRNCLRAGEENALAHFKRSSHWHEKCEYKGDCSCQHRTGLGLYVKKVSKETLTPTLSQ
jgi:hypothetical protein